MLENVFILIFKMLLWRFEKRARTVFSLSIACANAHEGKILLCCVEREAEGKLDEI